MSKKQIAKLLLALGLSAMTVASGIAMVGCNKDKDDDDKGGVITPNPDDPENPDDPDGPDKPGVPEDETDRAIVPEYTGPAAGPASGSQDVSYTLNGADLPVGALAEEYSNGIFTIAAGAELRNRKPTGEDVLPSYTRSIKNGKITVNVPSAGKLKFAFSSGSTGGGAKYKITGPGQEGNVVEITTGDKVLNVVEIEVTQGTYVFSKENGTVDTYEVVLTLNSVEASPITGITLVSAGTTDYLITQKVDCTTVQLVANDGNGVTHDVSLANCKFDTTKYNPNVSGEYEIGVTYYLESNLDSTEKEFSTKYNVKVYAVDSIVLDTVGLSGSKQVTAQQAYLTTDTYAKETNLSVIATCDFNGEKITKKLKSDWYGLTDNVDLSTAGKKTVTVAVDSTYTVGNKSVTATYEIISAAKKQAEDGVVKVTVGENGEFTSLTQAVQYLKKCAFDSGVKKVIELAPGTYTEKVWIDVDNVTLVGKGAKADDTTVTYSLVEGDADNLSGALWALNCATVHVTGANFKAYNVAIRNDFDYINNAGNYSGNQAAQGVALTLDTDGAVIYNCHLYGNQDTLYLKSGRSYYYQTQIDGNIDFIFGNANGLAFFDECKIVAISRNNSSQNGYVTAAKHEAASKPDYGYIFYKCELTDDGKVADGTMSLGRPWGAAATVAYIECSFSKAYSTAAYGDTSVKMHRWETMSGASPENAYFVEYGSTGEGAISSAVAGGSVLTQEQAANYTQANIFGTSNGKVGYTTAFDCAREYAILRILAGLDEGEIPETTEVTIDLKDETLPNGNCLAALNEKYGEYFTWEGAASFETAKPQNGVKIGTDTVITLKVKGEVSLLAGYELPAGDYQISYKDGYATIKFVKASGTYGTYLGGIVIDTSKDMPDTAYYDVTIHYGELTFTLSVKGEEVLTLDKIKAALGDEYAEYNVTGVYTDAACQSAYGYEPVNSTVELYITMEKVDIVYDTNATIDLTDFSGTVQNTVSKFKGIEIDTTKSGKVRANGNSVQVNAGTIFKIPVAEGATVTVNFFQTYGGNDIVTISNVVDGVITVTVSDDISAYSSGVYIVSFTVAYDTTGGNEGGEGDQDTVHESWLLDFTSTGEDFVGDKTSTFKDGDVYKALTIVTAGGASRHKDGYMKTSTGTTVTFTVEANATFTFKFNNSNSARNITFYIDGEQVGDPITADKAEHTVTLTKGTCTFVVAGGDIQISTMALSYGNAA